MTFRSKLRILTAPAAVVARYLAEEAADGAATILDTAATRLHHAAGRPSETEEMRRERDAWANAAEAAGSVAGCAVNVGESTARALATARARGDRMRERCRRVISLAREAVDESERWAGKLNDAENDLASERAAHEETKAYAERCRDDARKMTGSLERITRMCEARHHTERNDAWTGADEQVAELIDDLFSATATLAARERELAEVRGELESVSAVRRTYTNATQELQEEMVKVTRARDDWRSIAEMNERHAERTADELAEVRAAHSKCKAHVCWNCGDGTARRVPKAYDEQPDPALLHAVCKYGIPY